ncbi:F-box domain [Macleaya cordata]|uniref:F-box domain n=1 Tax=Macleaya cordata TaxID=56857 RepID=A0A200QFI3_MACCD|nr:F-box domain [Macleaya cordata]
MESLLPTEITIEIFSRLPAESILECRRVCRSWRRIINHTNFADMHLRRQLLQLDQDHKKDQNHSGLGMDFLFLIEVNRERKLYQCYYREYDEDDPWHCYKKLLRVNLPPINCFNAIVGSCNGLICFPISPNIKNSIIHDPVYICNPITREYVNLPKFVIKNEYANVRIVCGFGYVPSTNEYKVVRIFYGTPDIGLVQVYTLGSGHGWRNKGEISYSFRHTWPLSPGMLANGALHWLLNNELKIVAFDLADEEFHLVPSPPCIVSNHRFESFELRVLRGWLCFVHQKDVFNEDLWFLKKKKKNSSSNCDIKQQEYGSLSWSFKFGIKWNDSFAIAEVRLGYMQRICVYDPKTISSQKGVDYYTSFLLQKGIPYMKSFVSLKALGEENVQKIE